MQPLGCCFWSNFFDTGNVIAAIAHQSQVIDDLIRLNTKLFHHPRFIQYGIAHGIDQLDLICHQLRKILVTG